MIHINKILKLPTGTEYTTKEQFSSRSVVNGYVASVNCIAQPLSFG